MYSDIFLNGRMLMLCVRSALGLSAGRVLQGSDQQGTDLEISNKYFDNATCSACQSRKIITEHSLWFGAVGGTCSNTMPGVSHANWPLNLI